ncbi:MAG: nitrogen regulation protein NR(II) [Burkholderiales bacterium]|jgi:two-component system nitrogen regulation sensor histidine kinase GlnL|nr:nitrogen regulation protein NR(II) [Burkholderiales bacterium]
MSTDPPAPASLPAGGRERRLQPSSRLAGLDLLACGVVLLDERGNLRFLNQAAVQLFELPLRLVEGAPFARQFSNGGIIDGLVEEACNNAFGQKRQDITLQRIGREPLAVHCVAVVLESELGALLLEFREIDQRIRMDREARMLESVKVNRELVRNLAHEIKNPLGGIRGAAQLLETEVSGSSLREYTQVIIKEADRLQTLVDRLLAPHRHPRLVGDVNIHEVLERVRSVVGAEYPQGLNIVRDYDASLPDFRGDKEQLIQAMLNLVRNAAQALRGQGQITISTRIARQVTIDKLRYRLALDLHVVDDGPGVPEEIRDRIFLPLVSGREGGSGLGLTLAQTFVQQHGGLIECESTVGHTDFRILLPLP